MSRIQADLTRAPFVNDPRTCTHMIVPRRHSLYHMAQQYTLAAGWKNIIKSRTADFRDERIKMRRKNEHLEKRATRMTDVRLKCNIVF